MSTLYAIILYVRHPPRFGPSGTKEEPAPVNCWRMLLLANEYSELQTARWSSCAFTLLMLVSHSGCMGCALTSAS